MNYQISFDEQEMPAFMVEQLAICRPCNDNETVATFENDSEIDISFSSRGSEFSYLSSGTSPMARALERVGNEVALSQQQQQPRQKKQQRNQSKKSSASKPDRDNRNRRHRHRLADSFARRMAAHELTAPSSTADERSWSSRSIIDA
eukprot:CAMPEP_0197181984 /NCGR_PEP_ID=MMETSP1423-20130617/6098_1 /TAXON_ID=476441 /ORGANISM="Pseudo-nitzschia heimii, Strain UNC1101" /LENGTH=146 /DNA_ID=CAMNT_0042632341 /DNA_START=116 /DNA_END=557 /DNA_ORIENTATION=-